MPFSSRMRSRASDDPNRSSLSHRSGVGDFVLAIVTRDPLRERPQENQAGLSNG